MVEQGSVVTAAGRSTFLMSTLAAATIGRGLPPTTAPPPAALSMVSRGCRGTGQEPRPAPTLWCVMLMLEDSLTGKPGGRVTVDTRWARAEGHTGCGAPPIVVMVTGQGLCDGRHGIRAGEVPRVVVGAGQLFLWPALHTSVTRTLAAAMPQNYLSLSSSYYYSYSYSSSSSSSSSTTTTTTTATTTITAATTATTTTTSTISRGACLWCFLHSGSGAMYCA
ncbi:hypothetical protein E2C01_039054 [Portunus trituberculatus]|uniref:Uncharacterized protein n=1 Tax=Portunus trituberculatus TaxID=210409 RepID=A0A5B7FIK2_PORTR|nr:hypothetical protein [Portunus trituberculatus]